MKKLFIISQIDSTNSELLRRLPVPHGYGIMARRQTQGRGRQGRAWQSLEGDLSASFWLDELGEPLSALPLVACLAVLDALNAQAQMHGITALNARCKWPNDIRVHGHKLAGILAAYQHQQQGVILGIGVNLAGISCDFAQLGRPATSFFSETGQTLAPETLFCGIARRLAQRLRQWQRVGFEPLRSDWLARCDHVGVPVSVHCPDNTLVHGITRGIGPNGELLLDCNGTLRTVLCGDVETP